MDNNNNKDKDVKKVDVKETVPEDKKSVLKPEMTYKAMPKIPSEPVLEVKEPKVAFKNCKTAGDEIEALTRYFINTQTGLYKIERVYTNLVKFEDDKNKILDRFVNKKFKSKIKEAV